MKITDVLTPEEMARITARSDLMGWWLFTCQWALVIGIFWVVATWTNPITVIMGSILLGGRYLGFGILEHEAGHRSLFNTPGLNDFVGDWLISSPTFGNRKAYMRGHLQHHRLAGTEEDPDLANYRDYPITRERLKRKLTRDITGRTGARTLRFIWHSLTNLKKLNAEQRACFLRGLAMNGLMLATLTIAGEGWLYLMWVAGFVFITPLLSRIRQVAEHAAVPDLFDPDPRRNTRTVVPNPLARLLFCPHGVNYHLEHHFMASVPIYRLKEMHKLLKRKGFYDGVEFPNGYGALLRQVTRTAEASPAIS